MLPAMVTFTISAVAIIGAGTALARYADAIAEATGLGRLFVGMVLLAATTSLPELVVDISAVRMGLPDMAIGDLLGSSLFNLLILAIADLAHRQRGRMFSRASAHHAVAGAVSISLTATIALAIALEHMGMGPTFLRVGIGPVAAAVVFLLGIRVVFCDQRCHEPREGSQPTGGPNAYTLSTHTPSPMKLGHAMIGFAVAAVIIIVAGPFMASSAGQLAELSELGGTFFGTTFVAFCTSLPELVTTLAAIRIGSFDLASGNIFGSNAFNMSLFLPLDIAQPGSLLASAHPAHLVTCLTVIIVTSIAIIGQLYRVDRRIHFIEPSAILVAALVIGSLALVYLAV